MPRSFPNVATPSSPSLVSAEFRSAAFDAARRLARQEANCDGRRLSAYIGDRDERTADNSAAEKAST